MSGLVVITILGGTAAVAVRDGGASAAPEHAVIAAPAISHQAAERARSLLTLPADRMAWS
jgi:hypothetical protein